VSSDPSTSIPHGAIFSTSNASCALEYPISQCPLPALNAELLGCLHNTSRGSSNVTPAVAYTSWDYWKSFLDLVLLSWGYCTVCDDGHLKANNIAACASCVDTLSHYLSAGGVLLVGSLFKRCVAVSCEDRCGLHRDHSGGRARECRN
jgi:hypothetical protein